MSEDFQKIVDPLSAWQQKVNRPVEDFTLSKAKWQFILQSFGVQFVQSAILQPGQSITRDPADAPYTSSLGTPVWDNVVLKDQAENPNYMIRIDSVLIDATLPNIIKKTKVTGRRGTVKEYITEGDWQISIKGALFGEKKDQYPDSMGVLSDLCRVGQALEIESLFLNNYHKVYNVVVDRLRFIQRAGGMQKQAFEIRCSSDIPYELEGDGLVDNGDYTYNYNV